MTTTPAWYQAYTRLGRLFGFTVAPYEQVRYGPAGSPSTKTVEAQLRALGCSDKEVVRVLEAAHTTAEATGVGPNALIAVAVDAISVGIQPNAAIERHLLTIARLARHTNRLQQRAPIVMITDQLHPVIEAGRVEVKVLNFLAAGDIDLQALAGFYGTDRAGMFERAVRGQLDATGLMGGLERILADEQEAGS